MANSRTEAKELPCLFKFLIGDYPGSELAKCETLEKQKWRHADAPMVVNKAKALVKYLPKLSPFLNSLTDYSVCQKHYNNIIVKNFVLEQLEKVGDSVFFIPMKKNKKKIELSNNEPNFCDFEVQVSLPDPEYESLIKKINELERLNKQLLLENEILKKQLNNKYDNQQVRVEAAIEIAKRERNALYNDVVKLINDRERFHLDSLLNYSPSKWLMMRNPVVVEFIKTLTFNENEDHYEVEKLFKCAVVIDNIYGIRHLKYVSSINLALSAIKYSIAKSKTIIDIDGHIINAGGFTKFIKWQETLAGNSEPFPNGLVFMAFDNEQKGQKNYLDRGYNKVIFHTVTSFVLFNFNPTNQIQNFENPWLHQNLNVSQIESLFGLTPEMQVLLDRQLHDYLSFILTELCEEKKEDINVIDDLVINQSARTSNQKQCRECGKTEIENSKRKCPQCHAKLPTLAETQQEKEQTISDKKDKKDSNKPLIFRPYQPNTSISDKSTSSISIPQNLEPQGGVKIPDILVPDPLPINPNSVENIRKVFDHIQNISGINSGNRKWIVVVCDGLPYHYAQKFKNEYPSIILLPGPLHEEMNMLKAFVELNW
ncbi:hypothetical protein C2G38_2286020 [Gigaspora rosea]|uniref:Uncharacterized protein n=1 Tax=Gigaspora rosea TaxID=44941 RepID=A0A397U136_9GLOM|nr:hypothetical protein C2G38_2286020 [Gigaspora rosea]